jgi:hypothetical protein
MHTQLLSLKDVANRLGTQPYRIVYLLSTGKVPEPDRVGGKRVFCAEDLNRIAKQLGIDPGEEAR